MVIYSNLTIWLSFKKNNQPTEKKNQKQQNKSQTQMQNQANNPNKTKPKDPHFLDSSSSSPKGAKPHAQVSYVILPRL